MTLRTAYRALAGAVLLITLEMMHCTMSVGADQPDRTGGVFQNIPTLAAYEWNFFADSVDARDVEIIEFAGKRSLAVANYFDGSSYQGSLGLMEWLPESECFGAQAACNNLLQVVPVTAAFALDSISVGADTYLAVAIYFDGNSFQQNSLI